MKLLRSQNSVQFIALALMSAFLMTSGNFAFAGSSWLQQHPVHQDGYDELYPTYVEQCSATQYFMLPDDKGGTGGHAVLYLKGVCRDTSAAYPKLKMCEPGQVDLRDPNRGTGISVDKMFANANWVPIEGKDFFLEGGLAPDAPVNKEAFEGVVKTALEKGFFHGIRLHEKFHLKKPAGMSDEEYVVRVSVGTDFALTFARNLPCARYVVTPAMLAKMVDYLNGLNEKASRKDYHWNGVSNNCTHVVHNALWSAGIREYIPEDVPFPIGLPFVALPGNEFTKNVKIGNDGDISDVQAAYENSQTRETIQAYSWMSRRPGNLLELYAGREKNDLYQIGDGILMAGLHGPQNIRKDVLTPRYTDIRANLQYFEAQYRHALASLGLSLPAAGVPADFARKYYVTLQRNLDEVMTLQARLK